MAFRCALKKKSEENICSLKNNLSFYSEGKSQEEMIKCYTKSIQSSGQLLTFEFKFNITQGLMH